MPFNMEAIMTTRKFTECMVTGFAMIAWAIAFSVIF
jgi:hypothetical protein